MQQYGFVIDQRKCIGCHACTVACKSENHVPLGEFRTWVKYVEKGHFPEVKRHFTVLRCNHCDAAPCVEICPTVALHKREDAIVDLDRDACIGCRSCMQACPYDALYLDDSGTAGKCHFCAHRTEIGLEPACVVVCPEQAIVAGDLSDESTKAARLVAEEPTSQRKLEKGTEPRVWYVDALEESLQPGRAHEPERYIWSDRRVEPLPEMAGFEADPGVTTVLNADHPPVWGWHIWSYLLTKNIAAGVGIIAPFLALLGAPKSGARDWLPEVIVLLFLGITGFFLVHDLGRPSRFLMILLRPNTRSWLVRGTWILSAFAGLSTASLVARLSGADSAADLLRWAALPFAVFGSGYTAFLFAQCRGRDLWLEKGLFRSLVLRAALLGSIFGLLIAPGTLAIGILCGVLGGAVAFLAWRELNHRPQSENAAKAWTMMKRSPFPKIATIALGLAALIAVVSGLLEPGSKALILAVYVAVKVILSLFVLERAWIRAGQVIPLS